jgi:hypothetical protein
MTKYLHTNLQRDIGATKEGDQYAACCRVFKTATAGIYTVGLSWYIDRDISYHWRSFKDCSMLHIDDHQRCRRGVFMFLWGKETPKNN